MARDSKWTVAGSIGTVTEASLAFNARWGRIESPWWAFSPEQTTYVQETQPIPPPLGLGAAPEVFVFAGARVAQLRGLGPAISRALGIARVAQGIGLALFHVGQHRDLEIVSTRRRTS